MRRADGRVAVSITARPIFISRRAVVRSACGPDLCSSASRCRSSPADRRASLHEIPATSWRPARERFQIDTIAGAQITNRNGQRSSCGRVLSHAYKTSIKHRYFSGTAGAGKNAAHGPSITRPMRGCGRSPAPAPATIIRRSRRTNSPGNIQRERHAMTRQHRIRIRRRNRDSRHRRSDRQNGGATLPASASVRDIADRTEIEPPAAQRPQHPVEKLG